jgi:hypothetical protein
MLKELNKTIFIDNKRNTSIVGMLSIVIIIAVIFSMESAAITTLDAAEELQKLKDQVGGSGDYADWELRSETETGTGTTSENSEDGFAWDLDYNWAIVSFRATLHWVDTAPSLGLGFSQTNHPDEFEIIVSYPERNISVSDGPKKNDINTGEGTVSAEIVMDPVITDTEPFHVDVIAGDCGDVTGRAFGVVQTAEDTDNSWTITIEYSYYVFVAK